MFLYSRHGTQIPHILNFNTSQRNYDLALSVWRKHFYIMFMSESWSLWQSKDSFGIKFAQTSVIRMKLLVLPDRNVLKRENGLKVSGKLALNMFYLDSLYSYRTRPSKVCGLQSQIPLLRFWLTRWERMVLRAVTVAKHDSHIPSWQVT